MKSKKPFFLFVFLCFAFLVGEGMFSVIQHHYDWVHFYFGLAAPLCIGYFPTTLFRWNGWRHLPVNRSWQGFEWQWSVRAGLTGTFIASFVNEVIDDPRLNGVPFVEAWRHFAADVAGMALFTLLTICLLRRGVRKLRADLLA